MKRLASPRMRTILRDAKRRAKGSPPSDGMMKSLTYFTAKNGWHYQAEWVHDTRFEPKPYVILYAFKPPRNFSARSADYFLR